MSGYGMRMENSGEEAERLRQLPKLELHCHLDGSMTLESMRDILGHDIREEEVQVKGTCGSLAEYLARFAIPLQCVQTADGLRRAARAFLLDAARENIRYMEVRFAPLSCAHDGLNCRQAAEAVLAGLEQAKEQCGVYYNVIVCAMRHHTEQDNLAMLKSCRELLGNGVCAADLAGDEAAYPMEGFCSLFSAAKKMAFPYTIHAGECGRVQNVLEAVACGASRIGHGIALSGNPSAVKLCADRHIGIEMCPISNLQTRAASKESYPIREFIEAGLPVTLNTDNRSVSATSLTEQMCFVHNQYGITMEELKQLQFHAVEMSFADDTVKQELWRELKRAWD